MTNRAMTFRVRQNPHNDLEALAAYHVGTIKSKLESGHLEGLTLDCRSAAIALAFFNEAVLNYVGLRVLKKEWVEMAPFAKKVRAIGAKLNIVFDKKTEPFRTVDALREARNKLAHGKPAEFTAKVASSSELAKSMQPGWGLVDDPDTVLACFESAREFKKLLFAKARIKWATSLTSAFGGG